MFIKTLLFQILRKLGNAGGVAIDEKGDFWELTRKIFKALGLSNRLDRASRWFAERQDFQARIHDEPYRGSVSPVGYLGAACRRYCSFPRTENEQRSFQNQRQRISDTFEFGRCGLARHPRERV